MQRTTWRGAAVAALAAITLAGCGMMGDRPAGTGGHVVTLAGNNEVPPVTTTAVGTANVAVHADRTVVVKVIVQGMTPTAAHIHTGAPGANGPVIVPFQKVGDNEFVAASGTKLNDEQWAAYKAGNTYVNVHSAKHPGGEIRGQIRP
jgi:CHRD domain-containing protein